MLIELTDLVRKHCTNSEGWCVLEKLIRFSLYERKHNDILNNLAALSPPVPEQFSTSPLPALHVITELNVS